MSKVTCMPPTAYNRTISTIRDYPRMVMELEQMKRDNENIKASAYDGMPKGATMFSVGDRIALMVDLERDVKKIQECINSIPDDMRDGILNNILYNMPYPHNEYAQVVPSIRTWQNEKRKFIMNFAKTMHIWGYKKRLPD